MEHVQSEVRVDHEIIIVGAGFSGLGLGIQLKKRYLHDFVLLERADDLGGTWRDNAYPRPHGRHSFCVLLLSV